MDYEYTPALVRREGDASFGEEEEAEESGAGTIEEGGFEDEEEGE